MERLISQHVFSATRILDVGSRDVNGTYRSLFTGDSSYVGVDISEGGNVDIVLEDPYKLPFNDGTFDLVISGQTFEHCEFFWLLFAEMARVSRNHLIVIAPSRGHVHRHPVDCYRFHPDAWGALAKYAGLYLIECGVLPTYWGDSFGVFRHLDGNGSL